MPNMTTISFSTDSGLLITLLHHASPPTFLTPHCPFFLDTVRLPLT